MKDFTALKNLTVNSSGYSHDYASPEEFIKRTSGNLVSLGSCKALEVLNIEGLAGLKTLEGLGECHRLQELTLPGTYCHRSGGPGHDATYSLAGVDSLIPLAACTGLRKLHMTCNEQVSSILRGRLDNAIVSPD